MNGAHFMAAEKIFENVKNVSFWTREDEKSGKWAIVIGHWPDNNSKLIVEGSPFFNTSDNAADYVGIIIKNFISHVKKNSPSSMGLSNEMADWVVETIKVSEDNVAHTYLWDEIIV